LNQNAEAEVEQKMTINDADEGPLREDLVGSVSRLRESILSGLPRPLPRPVHEGLISKSFCLMSIEDAEGTIHPVAHHDQSRHGCPLALPLRTPSRMSVTNVTGRQISTRTGCPPFSCATDGSMSLSDEMPSPRIMYSAPPISEASHQPSFVLARSNFFQLHRQRGMAIGAKFAGVED